ncbi:hypothetical protein JCM10213v2_009077 [Rhodosporidiobolus nylandii]
MQYASARAELILMAWRQPGNGRCRAPTPLAPDLPSSRLHVRSLHADAFIASVVSTGDDFGVAVNGARRRKREHKEAEEEGGAKKVRVDSARARRSPSSA